jgi:hypothetical protein
MQEGACPGRDHELEKLLRHRIGLLALLTACEIAPIEPCSTTSEKPILEIGAASNQATGVSIPVITITQLTLDGAPVDTALVRSNSKWNVERTSKGIVCTLPCSFGRESGTYAFEARASGFYLTAVNVSAEYSRIPAGCPAAHGTPSRVALSLTEADSARVHFNFTARRATGLGLDIATVTFDDGSGPRTSTRPWQTYPTRNAGTLHVRFVVAAPDTIAIGEVDLPLRKDWEWAIRGFLYDENPTGLCIQAKSFPLRRPVAGADSFYIGWAGTYLSVSVVC